MRFYERQFITREDMNHDTLARFEEFLDDYLYSGSAATLGIPTVKYFADKICFSPNYFGDLVKQETGKTAQEYIQLKMISIAKERIFDPACTIKQIAESLLTISFQVESEQRLAEIYARELGVTADLAKADEHYRRTGTCRLAFINVIATDIETFITSLPDLSTPTLEKALETINIQVWIASGTPTGKET